MSFTSLSAALLTSTLSHHGYCVLTSKLGDVSLLFMLPYTAYLMEELPRSKGVLAAGRSILPGVWSLSPSATIYVYLYGS
jgi:hypothetical protein